MQRLFISTLIVVTLSLRCYSQELIRLYEGKAPGSENWNYNEVEFSNPGTATKMLRNVVDPTLEVYTPEKSVASGVAVIICPGGGNVWLSYESEGTAVAEWLANKGITAFVLKYRLNKTPEDPDEFKDFWNNFGSTIKAKIKENSDSNKESTTPPKADRNYAGEDGLEAVRYVREHAEAYDIDPNKIGIMGFSAGAGVTMHVILNSPSEGQPNFAGVIYGGWLRGSEVPQNAPPLFILCAADDFIAAGSPELFKAWREAKIPAELHIYSKGGHGFGMDKKDLPVDGWIDRFYEWLEVTTF